MSNPLVELQHFGQSVWYDNISRGLIMSGELKRLIEADGILGLTSNPAIFEKAISGSEDYAGALRALAVSGRSTLEIYEQIAVEDIQRAADLLLPVYEASAGGDGFVSLEVSPRLADDTAATVDEGLRLAGLVGRRNLMIKVPGTAAGLPAITQLIGEGINVNVTLLFSRTNYEQVAQAYIDGVEALLAKGGSGAEIASVASFFISRIDTLADEMIIARIAAVDRASDRLALRQLLGKIAVANARLAYATYKQICATTRWQTLAEAGARPQRLLWASTSTKNPEYRDVLYVEELIGPDTVNTMPEATVDAFRDHGVAASTLEKGLDEARDVMNGLEELGISMDQITDKLQRDAVRLFVEPFDSLLAAIEAQIEAVPKRA